VSFDPFPTVLPDRIGFVLAVASGRKVNPVAIMG
jgi:ribosomal protein S19